MTNQAKPTSLPPLRTRLQPFLDEAREYIRANRDATGLGPLWRELAARFGVTKPVGMRVFIWHLRKIGAVGFTQERGSLDLSDPATAAAEAQWSSQEWAKAIREHMAAGSPFSIGDNRQDTR